VKFPLLASLLLFSVAASADMAQQVDVNNPYARAAIQQQRNSATFMSMQSHGSEASLVGAQSPVAKIVELHTHINDKGVMRMRKIPKIDLPKDKMVTLQPGGLHIMLLGLNRDLKPGEEIEVTLQFADGSSKDLKVPVQKMMMHKMKNMKKHKMDGSMPKVMTH
jgi:copper(I)-binding protein